MARTIRGPEAKKHRPALLTFPELGEVLRRAHLAPISHALRLYHRLIAFTATCISNAVAARSDDFGPDSTLATWTIPRAQLKNHGFEKPVVDLALDHGHDTDVARAYDRGERMKQPIALATWW